MINSLLLAYKRYSNSLLILFKKVIGLEAFIWISALLFLGFINNPATTHFSICPLYNIGFNFCPGCGLGNSVSYIIHGEITNSFIVHPLGIFALLILLSRIYQLIKSNWSNYGKHITTNALS